MPKRSAQPDLDASLITGAWKLVAFEIEYQDTGERKDSYGKAPRGRLMILPNGLMMTVITGDQRPVPQNDKDRASAFKTMFAYSGRYEVDGDQWRTKVDIAWNETWTNTIQTRSFSVTDSQLVAITAWTPSAGEPQRTVRGILTWEREA